MESEIYVIGCLLTMLVNGHMHLWSLDGSFTNGQSHDHYAKLIPMVVLPQEEQMYFLFDGIWFSKKGVNEISIVCGRL